MRSLPNNILLICFLLGAGVAVAQTPAQPPAQAPAANQARPSAPARDPNTPGYVKAKELPDGAVRRKTTTSSSGRRTRWRPRCR